MANILARFRRGRATSLTATSALTSPGLTLQNTPAPAPAQLNVPTIQSPPLERKIHPDLDSLVADWTPPAPGRNPASTSSSPAPLSTALRPSTRRHSIDGAVPVLRPPQTDTHLEDLPELPVPIPFTLQPETPTRARRLITRLTGSSSPPSSMTNVASTSTAVGWSTFGRRSNNGADAGRPHLTDFGEHERGSPAPSQGTSISHSQSFSPSRSPSQVNLGTPSTTSQQLEGSVTYSSSGHGHQLTPGSEIPSPSSGFTFGSQGRMSGRASAPASPPPPMPPLDHPAFGRIQQSISQSQMPSSVYTPQSPQSPRLAKRHPRASSSLPSLHSTSRRKRFRGGVGDRLKVQDMFASLSRPSSSRRRASAELSSDQAAAAAVSGNWEANVSREVIFLALRASGGNEMNDKREPTHPDRDNGDMRDGDLKFDARAKRVGGPSDTQLGEPFVWPDIPAHSVESSSSTMEQKNAAAELMPPALSFTVPTPQGSPAASARMNSTSEGLVTVLRPPTPTRSQSDGPKLGKRKVDDVESGSTPPQDSKATITLDPRALNPSNSTASSSQGPLSSFHRQKRAKLAMGPDQPPSRPRSATATGGSGSGSSRVPPHTHARQLSRAGSHASSLPISALVSPHAPSVARSAGGTAYHMRDPRKPPRVQPTEWGLAFGDGGSPVHAWLFFVGFVLFPVWWIAGFCVPVPRTRHLGDAAEKGVVLDDPQEEADARAWRRRCRIMAGVSLVTYVPFIVLVAVFVPRG